MLIDPVTLSLADGHYLKVGLALQLAPPEGEEATAAEGGHGGGSGEEEPAMSADGGIVDVYFTAFAMQ